MTMLYAYLVTVILHGTSVMQLFTYGELSKTKCKFPFRLVIFVVLSYIFYLGPGPASTLVVPEMSYSSSEGEEDFYDANDSPFSTVSQGSTPT